MVDVFGVTIVTGMVGPANVMPSKGSQSFLDRMTWKRACKFAVENGSRTDPKNP
jgi:hypothetical protein